MLEGGCWTGAHLFSKLLSLLRLRLASQTEMGESPLTRFSRSWKGGVNLSALPHYLMPDVGTEGHPDDEERYLGVSPYLVLGPHKGSSIFLKCTLQWTQEELPSVNGAVGGSSKAT